MMSIVFYNEEIILLGPRDSEFVHLFVMDL